MAEEESRFNPSNLYLERVGDSSNGYKQIHFTKADSRIGRADNMEISIASGKTVSREQTRIIFIQGRMYIENLSKTNYTFLNFDRVVQRSEVEVGDYVGLGTRPNARHLNPGIAENQKFVYICKRNEETEIIELSDDEDNVQESKVVHASSSKVVESQIKEVKVNNQKEPAIEQNNNEVLKTPLFSPQSSIESASSSSLRPNIEVIIKSLGNESQPTEVVATEENDQETLNQLKRPSLVLIKMTEKDIADYKKKLKKMRPGISVDSSDEEEDSTEKTASNTLRLTNASPSTSYSSTPSRDKAHAKDTIEKLESEKKSSESKKKPKQRRDSIFLTAQKFSKSKIEKLQASEQIREKLKLVVDEDSNDSIAPVETTPTKIKDSSQLKININERDKTASGSAKRRFPSLQESQRSSSASPSSSKKARLVDNESPRKAHKSISNSPKVQPKLSEKAPSRPKFQFPPMVSSTPKYFDTLENREAAVEELSRSDKSSCRKSVDSTIHKSSSSALEASSADSEMKESELPARVKKRRQSMYVRHTSAHDVGPVVITREIDMFAKASMMRSEALRKINKAPVVVSKVSNNMGEIKKRRMSYAGEAVRNQTETSDEPKQKPQQQFIPDYMMVQQKPKASAFKVKYTPTNRGHYLTEQVVLPARRMSTATRPAEEASPAKPPDGLKDAITIPDFRAKYVKDNNGSRSGITPSAANINDVINSNMESNHRKLSTVQQQAIKPKAPEDKPTSAPTPMETEGHHKESTGFYKSITSTVPELTSCLTDSIKEKALQPKTLELTTIESDQNGAKDKETNGIKVCALAPTNVKSILKASTSQAPLCTSASAVKNVKFVDDDKLVSILEITPSKSKNHAISADLNALRPTFSFSEKRSQLLERNQTLPSVAVVQPIQNTLPSFNQLLSEAIDKVLVWNAEWLCSYDYTVNKYPQQWKFRRVENHYATHFEYLETLRRIAGSELLKKMAYAYRSNSKKSFEFLTVKDRTAVNDGRTKLTLKIGNEKEHANFKSGHLLLLRARNNSLPVPKDTDFLGYITASNHNYEINVEILTKDIYEEKCVIKAKPLMYLRSEVISLAAIQSLETSAILWKIIQIGTNGLEPYINNNQLSWAKLSPEQEFVIRCLVCENNRQHIMVINGGPGSGKSEVMIETILHVLQSSKNRKKFLICSNSNSSIDHIASIFFNMQHIRAVRIGNAAKMSHTAFKMSLEEQVKVKMESKRGLKYSDVMKEIVDNADVVLTTTMSSSRLWEFNKSYEMCFIEGANLITDCELIIPAQLKSKKLILIGDENQPDFSRKNLNENRPLFMRMMDFFKNVSNTPIFNLTIQHRLTREVFHFCNRHMFKNKMKLSINKSNSSQNVLKPYKIFGVNTTDMNAQSNPYSSATMTSVTLELCSTIPPEYKVGILAMSQRQREDIAAASQFRPQRMQVLSYEASQGIEKDVIVLIILGKDLSLTNDMVHILLTRAKIALYILTDLSIVNYNKWGDTLREFYKKAERYSNYHVAEPNSDAFSKIFRTSDAHDSPES